MGAHDDHIDLVFLGVPYDLVTFGAASRLRATNARARLAGSPSAVDEWMRERHVRHRLDFLHVEYAGTEP
jgi:hypothetical protein